MLNEVLIPIDKKSNMPLYEQVYNGIREEILNGSLKANQKLPSVRYMSSLLSVSRNTIEAAYERLDSEGYISSKKRSGYYIQQLHTDLFEGQLVNLEETEVSKEVEPFCEIEFDFSGNRVDTNHFPLSVWKRITNQCLKEQHEEVFFFGHPQGEVGLRREIASYIRQSRGVQCTEEQIVIGSHTQYLLNLLCQMIGIDGQTVAFENPGYYAARQVFELLGYNVQLIPVGVKGIDLKALEDSEAKLVYVTPSHQIPMGYVMPVKQRLELINWAMNGNRYIIEDDLNSEFRYYGQPIPALQHLDQHGKVIYMGTFFKSLLPSIRLNYMVLPPTLVKIYQEQFIIYQQTTSRILQKTVEIFMKEGYWSQHIKRMRKLYKKRCEWTVSCLHKYMSNKVDILGDQAGHHVVIQLKEREVSRNLQDIALHNGIRIDSVNIFLADKQMNSLYNQIFMLSFSALSEEEIHAGIRKLSKVWFSN
ncbi:MocR-like pyridoxine biosynthesis transcription factor PdxR [Bacillus sp. CHD6a]|uniref:MocR-like pyridoxine biosynthesis transcription factor PdxR n=1 Tax=Bacillus sp. CHD6a TaxID=1643452 RepID=UPI0007611BD5|nr:PLP-dependent aminotransferase family protein [Bacillus sp. CHD6a]